MVEVSTPQSTLNLGNNTATQSPSGKRSTTQSFATVGVKKMDRSFGSSKTHGDPDGVKKVTSGIDWFNIFRMKRGVDESAIESMAEAADPIVLGRKHGAFVEIP